MIQLLTTLSPYLSLNDVSVVLIKCNILQNITQNKN